MQRGGFPEDTAKLEKLLQSPEQLAAVVKEMEGFCDAYQANREILRFHFHRPNAILHRLEQAQIPAEVFPLDGQFKVERPTFITEDEINEVLAPGGGYSDSKLAAYVFFQNHTDRKERQDYLKESFGTGGSGSSIRDTWHDAKGMPKIRNWKNWLHPALRCRSRPNRQHLCSPNRLKQKITALLLPIWEWAARKQSIRRMWLLSGC